MKYFRLSWDEVLWSVSYANLNMLLVTIPSYEGSDKKEKTEGSEKTSLQDIFNKP